ncbi:unnamed protein product [Tilletia caries]|uniref:DDE Tnp4 domain-containing protein n=1 Tax=Tilletia caries TaxID=13290 RepID=A0ABN7J113_9BASI|nr:unnamed protein product [Tilletia caries]CAD6939173.1 unnamed protein product [Tilletia caries]CAD6951119.1 unnamed protein product [Tilletia caries]
MSTNRTPTTTAGWETHTAECSQVLVFLANGEIAWASFNNPGSWHDTKIANGLYDMLSNPERTPAPFALLADSAFPTNKEVSGKILSKPKESVAALPHVLCLAPKVFKKGAHTYQVKGEFSGAGRDS